MSQLGSVVSTREIAPSFTATPKFNAVPDTASSVVRRAALVRSILMSSQTLVPSAHAPLLPVTIVISSAKSLNKNFFIVL